MRISDWSSDVCSSDLLQEAGESIRARLKPLRSGSTTTDTTWRACNEPVPQPAVLDRAGAGRRAARTAAAGRPGLRAGALPRHGLHDHRGGRAADPVRRAVRAVAGRSEEHTSELQSLMRISYAVF